MVLGICRVAALGIPCEVVAARAPVSPSLAGNAVVSTHLSAGTTAWTLQPRVTAADALRLELWSPGRLLKFKAMRYYVATYQSVFTWLRPCVRNGTGDVCHRKPVGLLNVCVSVGEDTAMWEMPATAKGKDVLWCGVCRCASVALPSVPLLGYF